MSHGHGLCVEREQQQRMHSVTDDDDDGDGHVEYNAQRYYLCTTQPEQHNKKQVRRSMFGCFSFSQKKNSLGHGAAESSIL